MITLIIGETQNKILLGLNIKQKKKPESLAE
jgi:hypothetical protein